MKQETMLKIKKDEHGGADFYILIKHNMQIQWETFSRRSAGWSNGEKRSQRDIDEFQCGSKSGSVEVWKDYTDSCRAGSSEEK